MLKSLLVLAQRETYFYVEDVPDLAYVNLKLCFDAKGDLISVTEVEEKTTYTNQEKIQAIIAQEKAQEYLPKRNYQNRCLTHPYTVVNSTYKSKKPLEDNCSTNFKEGTFKYDNPEFKEMIVVRKDGLQTESSENLKIALSLSWRSSCEYVLTYTHVSDPESQYLIGETTQVKIIDVLEKDRYLYFANLGNWLYSYGIMEKL